MQVLDLSSKPRVKGAKHWFQEINQLYHPTGEFEQDSQDIVYSYDNLNTTKFVPILLKEWFYLVKEGGYLVIDYIPNKRSNFKKLEQQMWWLWKGKYDIVYHGKIEQRAQNKEQIIDFVKNPPDQPDPSKEDGSYYRFVVKKLESTKILGDSVGKWTFGMLTMGDRNECVKQTLRGTAIRSGDWITYGSNTLDLPYNIAKLDYKDLDEQIYVGGMLTILKKSIAKECPWSEIRYWGEEDVELTFRQRGHGYLARFNPYSSIEALSWRFGELPSKYYLSQGLLPKDMLLRRFMRQLNKLVFSVPILREATSPLVVMFIKSRLYRFLTSH